MAGIVAGSFPPPALADDSRVVDELWKARQDENVVDTFLTLEESMAAWKTEREESARQEVVNSPEVELVAVSETSSEDADNREKERNAALRKLLSPVGEALFGVTEPPSVHLLSEHRQPKQGERWDVRFTTTGKGTLVIRPADEATIKDDEFMGLWCGARKVPARLGEGDTIYIDNWSCDDIATVSHMTLTEGSHYLSIAFEEAAVEARNGPNTYKVMGFFYDPLVTASHVGNASASVRMPDPAPGDLMLAIVAIRPSTDIVNTPSGWTSLGSQDGTDGAGEAADTGSTRLYTMYKIADGTEGTANQTFTESGTPSVWGVKLLKFRSASGTYDIATTSLAKNGDTTAFGGTFPNANINLQSGDSIVLAAASNGNVTTGYAGWAISATGASFGTVSEVIETTSSTGNDQRFAAAKTYVTGGTAHSDATVTITATNASSGASTLVRIRQGEGANRTDTFLRSCGVGAAGSTSVAPAYPENEPGDLLLLITGNRDSTVSPSTPASWTLLDGTTGGSGVFGADAGNARAMAYSRIVTGSAPLTGTQSVTITSGNTSIGYICAVHRDGAYSWTTDVDTGSDNTPDTSWSVTGAGINLTGDDGGDVVLTGNAINTDVNESLSAHAMSASGITFDYVNDVSQSHLSATGNDMQLSLSHGEVGSGTGTGAPTYTMTAISAGGSRPAGASVIVAARGIYTPYDGRRVKLISGRLKVNEGARVRMYQQL